MNKCKWRPCLLKTGVRDGATKGRSFYVCSARHGTPCDFTRAADIPPSHCLHHEDSLVELQALIDRKQQAGYRYVLFFRCVLGKSEGKKWCGSVPWMEKQYSDPCTFGSNHYGLPNVQFLSPGATGFTFGFLTSHKKLLQQKHCSSPPLNGESLLPSFPCERNPFKASKKTEKPSEWRNIQEGGDRTGEKTSVRQEEEGESEAERSNHSNDEHLKSNWRNEQLPPGVRLKKKVTDEAQGSADLPPDSGPRQRPVIANAAKDLRPTSFDDRERRTGKKDQIQREQPLISKVQGKECGAGDQRWHKDAAKRAPKEGSSDLKMNHRPEMDDEVLLVSVEPGTKQNFPAVTVSTNPVQTALTSFPGFQLTSRDKAKEEDPRVLHNQLSIQLKQKKATLSTVNILALPDKGERLKNQVKELEVALESLSLTVATSKSHTSGEGVRTPAVAKQTKPLSNHGGTILLPDPPVSFPAGASCLALDLSQGNSQMYGVNAQGQALYGGRMTDSRLLAVHNATTEAIDHLHRSLESCPGPHTEERDPTGLKVPLLPHQRRALAWLLWRETQKPCGGILADDMGLGKTLTMIALILAQKKTEEKVKKLEGWISKNDLSLVASHSTLIICPASLIHHWKKEIERHVKSRHLSVYLYHGPNRKRNATFLAEHSVVVTTYSIVSKEVPAEKDVEKPMQDSLPDVSPLLCVVWSRVILDEAHNIKNPKVQTSIAVCKLRAQARWAVTGTPVQNNLLDMYALLKFLRCSPFDEYKLWKAQVDNGSKRGGERLNILTRALLLRRTKDELDLHGKPLVPLPERVCEVHQLKLSDDEQAVYDVIFARSRSTLESYLKRHEGGGSVTKKDTNPFQKVAHEFGMSVPDAASSQHSGASNTVHILSLLLRLRQCCCHLSLLKKTLDESELQGDGLTLSLEEQLSALSLSEHSSSHDPKGTVSLNGSRFRSELFDNTCASTKISAVLVELSKIRKTNEAQKSVIVSQWTSMLHIVAVHLKKLGLRFAVIDGTVNPKQRMDLVEEFNTNPKGPQVMLVSLCAGGVGINLVGGNHLFLMDMHWNPALEDQACDRIYRVGQTRNVTIHRFVCEGTVEDKISSLQQTKKELAKKVLSGTSASFTKLSLADLKIIFGV
uniref:Transcription termination factor 2 n=1 Tax=Scleropages formosus TaxID=113540 RepID=A0A8C9U0E8_SCLFO